MRIYAHAMTAFVKEIPVRIFADDAHKLDGTDYCILRGISSQK